MSSDNQDKITGIESVFQIAEKIKNEPTLKIQLGHDTDIGGGRVNQDRYTVFTLPEHDVCAISVADGHFTETGHFVADITKKSLEELLKNRITELIENPVVFLEICCHIIHEEIRKGLVEIIEKTGYEVKVNDSGVISKRRLESLPWIEIRGGTTFSIVLLIGKKIYIANLGDSAGLLCCKHPVLGLSNIKYEKDVANPTKVMPNGDVNGSLST